MKLLEVIAENVPGTSLAPVPKEPPILEVVADRPEVAPLMLRKVDGLWEFSPVMQNTEIGLLALSNLPNGQKACRELAGRVAFGKVLAEMLNDGDMVIDDIPGLLIDRWKVLGLAIVEDMTPQNDFLLTWMRLKLAADHTRLVNKLPCRYLNPELVEVLTWNLNGDSGDRPLVGAFLWGMGASSTDEYRLFEADTYGALENYLHKCKRDGVEPSGIPTVPVGSANPSLAVRYYESCEHFPGKKEGWSGIMGVVVAAHESFGGDKAQLERWLLERPRTRLPEVGKRASAIDKPWVYGSLVASRLADDEGLPATEDFNILLGAVSVVCDLLRRHSKDSAQDVGEWLLGSFFSGRTVDALELSWELHRMKDWFPEQNTLRMSLFSQAVEAVRVKSLLEG